MFRDFLQNHSIVRKAALIVGAAIFAFTTGPVLFAQDQNPPPGDDQQAPYTNLSNDQLDRLVAPIALYPDSLVAQILSAATFPSQIVVAEQFVKAHAGLSPADLGTQIDQQDWDPSVKALAQFPSVLKNLSANLGWTSELGDAYYNQQQDVMSAVQRMRQKAKAAGNLKSTPQLDVQDQNGEIDIAPVQPDVVYVPAYNPWLVYGYPIAPWPYWIDVPGIWWGGPGIYFGLGFPIAPFLGFGWGWHAWGMNWYHGGVFYNHGPYFPRGGAFFDRRGYYGGRPDIGRAGGFRGGPAYRGYGGGRPPSGLRSGPFSGYDRGGATRGYSARGQRSYSGGFHGGGFSGGGFHGGFHGGGGGRR
jgi:hypothetical protein